MPQNKSYETRIPERVEVVARVIRKHIPRPSTHPVPNTVADLGVTFLRWNGKCPLGLLPTAKTNCPTFGGQVGWIDGLTNDDVQAFADWWDRQSDPLIAVNTVWGNPSEEN